MTNIFEFEDEEFTPDPFYKDNSNSSSCIIIDNGSHTCRAGWSHEHHPKLQFRNLIAKYRGKKDADSTVSYYFGNDIEALEDTKWNIRTQFDMDVVAHFDIQENAFDYLFQHLGISSSGFVDHPVCITEAVCIPNLMRQNMSELLFECYSVPQAIYGVDKMFSWYKNMSATQYGLIIGCGYQSTHVLPIVNGDFDAGKSRRLNLGGFHMMVHLRQLLQLRHPNQAPAIDLSRAQELLKSHTYIPVNFYEELNRWKNKEYKKESEIKIKLPLINTVTEKDIELRRIQAKRLKEINQKKREGKIKQDKDRLEVLIEISDLECKNLTSFRQKLKQEGFKNENELDTMINDLKEKIEDREKKSHQFYEEMENWHNQDVFSNDGKSLEEIEETIKKLEDEKNHLLEKKRQRFSRKQALTKRKSYASKERMRILSQLAKSSNVNKANVSKSNKEDTFGMNDKDWDVYKYINKYESDSDEEQNQERLNEIEQSLTQSQLLLNRLLVGRGEAFEYLSFNTEQIHIPEMLFQPSIIGNEQEGITGMIEYVLKNYTQEIQNKMIENIFFTGGPSHIKGFKERLEAEIMSTLPFQSKFKVIQNTYDLLDSWYGAQQFLYDTQDITSIAISKSEYEEYGLGFLKEHKCSNTYIELKD